MSTPETPPSRPGYRPLVVVAVLVVGLVVTLVVSRLGSDDLGPEPVAGSTPRASAATSAAGSSGAPETPVPSASVPAPTATGPATVVAERPVKSTEAPLTERVDLGNGVTAQVEQVESVDGKPRGPGEIGGPALRITVRVRNNSGADQPMDAALVNLYYGRDKTPASGVAGPGSKPFRGALKAGDTARGRYVFSVAKADQSRIGVEFSYSTEVPTVIFSGDR